MGKAKRKKPRATKTPPPPTEKIVSFAQYRERFFPGVENGKPSDESTALGKALASDTIRSLSIKASGNKK